MSEFREPPKFRFWRDVHVRFRDLDPMGHVHHSLALMYVEDARAAYWREIAGRPTVADIDYVIGEVRVRYHERILYPDDIRVGVRVSRIGSKSIQMEFEIRSTAGMLLVSGGTTHVMFDFARGESAVVTDELRTKLEAFESQPSQPSTWSRSMSAQEVVHRHLAAIPQGVDSIMADYSENAIMFTQQGTLSGTAAIRSFFQGFLNSAPPGLLQAFTVVSLEANGEYAYLTWKADPFIPFATDTFVVKNDRIEMQSFAMFGG